MTEENENVVPIPPYESKTEEQIKKISLDLYKNLILTSVQIDPNSFSMVFISHTFGDAQYFTWIEENNIHVLYGYYTDSGPRSINGYPMFSKHYCLDLEDWKKIYEKYQQNKTTMENL